MLSLFQPLDGAPPGASEFATTQWQDVLAATGADSQRADEAFARLCRAYWYPLYAFVRRKGHDPDSAQDLTQEFFARLLARNYLQAVDRQRGRFRSFLLAALTHFLDNEWDKVHRLKRGGQYQFISWEEAQAEGRYSLEPAHELTADKIYERRWALTVLARALEWLQQEYRRTGKAALFESLQGFLSGEYPAPSHAELSAGLGMSEGAIKVAVHRLRRRYAEALRAEIASTVGDPGEIDDEVRYLCAAVSG